MVSRRQTYSAGFTIAELLVVIVIIGILAAITIVSYTGISNRATVASLTSDLTNASTQLKLDQTINGLYPNDLASANGGKGVPASSGTTYQYSYSNSTNPQTFCIAATKGSMTYKTTSDGLPTVGDCQSYGLVMSLDAGNTASYPGSGTTWTYLSGNGNNGTLNSGVTYSSSNSGILSFDGASGVISRNASINTGNNFSVFAWVKPQTATHGRNVVVNNSYPYSVDQGWLLCFQSNNSFFLSVGNDNAYGQSASGVVTNGAWNYIGATMTNGGALTNLYLNGASTNVISGVQSTRNISYTNNTFYIGNRDTEFFNGQIGEVVIYNRVLSSSDVQQNFNALRGRYGI